MERIACQCPFGRDSTVINRLDGRLRILWGVIDKELPIASVPRDVAFIQVPTCHSSKISSAGERRSLTMSA